MLTSKDCSNHASFNMLVSLLLIKICSFREAKREVVYGRGATATTMTYSDVLGYLTKVDNLSLLVIRNAGMAVPLE